MLIIWLIEGIRFGAQSAIIYRVISAGHGNTESFCHKPIFLQFCVLVGLCKLTPKCPLDMPCKLVVLLENKYFSYNKLTADC